MNLMKKLTGIFGGAALLAMGINSVPAEAALLDFSLNNFGKQFSFTLDTSVTDQNPDPFAGFFPNAISGITIDGSSVPGPSTVNLNTIESVYAGFGGIVGPGEFSGLSLFFRGLDVEYSPQIGTISTYYFFVFWFDSFSLVNQLSSDPNDYAMRIGYGREDILISYRSDIPPERLSVTLRQDPSPHPVPEPSTMVGLSVLGLSFLLKKAAQKA